MNRTSLILTIAGMILLGLGIWRGYEVMKYLGLSFWALGSLVKLIPIIKKKLQKVE